MRVLHGVWIYRAMWLLIAVLSLGFVASGSWAASPVSSAAPTAPAVSHSPPASPAAAASAPIVVPTPVPLTEQQNVISFLGGAIAWYRQFSVETGLVEEPSEALYLSADWVMTDEIVKLAFDYADAEAALIAKFGGSAQTPPNAPPGAGASPALGNRLALARSDVDSLQARVKDLSTRLRTAPRRQRDALTRQLLAAQAELELAGARVEFLTTMGEFEHGTSPASQIGTLQAQIDELRQSVQAETKPKVRQPAEGQQPVEPNGLVGLAEHLLDLRTKVATIDQRQSATQTFATLVARARAPLEQGLASVDKSARQLSQLALGNDRTSIEQRKKDFEHLITRRKLLDAALLPLTKQTMLLRRYADNLAQWRTQVLRHSGQVLRALIVHLAGLLLVIALIVTLAMIWRRLAVRYVEDINRRRQILKVRDATVVVLVIVVLLFNFTSELGALATVVGFAAAGIAVALQDVIMSIAGYFRLSGRFGIKHGDRVELQGVRGQVVELGLTKVTLLELGGDGIQSGPTGRLVTIPNSIVFRDKFLNYPGHSLMIWRELRFTLSPDCDFRVVEKQLLEVVEEVFARYRDNARSQLQEIERNLNTRVDSGRPQSRVRLGPDGLQIILRFPVDVRSEAQVVDEISRRLLDYIARDPRLRFVPTGTPNIQPIATPSDAEDADHAPADAQQPNPPARSQSS